jgi:hypothetical protein
MATINLTGGVVASGVPAAAVTRWDSLGKVRVEKITVDLTGVAITENDIYQCIAIPANTLIRAAVLRIDTAAVGTTLTIDVGFTGGAEFVSNADGKAVATNAPALIGVAEASAQGTFVTTADTLDVSMDVATAITAGPKFTLMVELVDFN